ncbi:MAG TPA: L-fucose/L-arabinose isomerase family protein [Acidimicrobiales bacterium]|nr:L-fucose/L-arabinose isomerase family protein [Acidimicrobiales bacterium]
MKQATTTKALAPLERATRPVTVGLIVGNRGFFPSALCRDGRVEMLEVLRSKGLNIVALGPEETEYGSVESLHDAGKCAQLFRDHADEIDGIVVTLPNFGDERALANAIRGSRLEVPVLVHAFPDQADRLGITHRRDSFCGKLSACNNLSQYGVAFSLTSRHTCAPRSAEFAADLDRFVRVCQVVRAVKGMRVGAIGARPANFNTVRYSEKLLERAGISVITLDLSEVLGRTARLKDDDPDVKEKCGALTGYTSVEGVPSEALVKMAKLGVVIDEWSEAERLDGSTIQCWTAIEEFYGVVPCSVMSMLSDSLRPSACELDVGGVVSMLVLQAASGGPSAILDWNNNVDDDPNKAIVFHCSNIARSFMGTTTMSYQEILAGTIGKERTYGAVYGRIKAGPATYLRVSTDEFSGKMRAYVGEGCFTDDPASTFGGYGVIEVPRLQSLLQFICRNGFEHHVAMNLSQTAEAVKEALGTYLGWEVYLHP